MKKSLSILLSIISLTLMAQVPQGVGYQGVATDANGIELVNQSISIRASVLSGSATGTIEWEETHTLTINEMPSFMTSNNPIFTMSGGFNTAFLNLSSIQSQSIGGDQAHNNMQPYLIMNYIIKY
jgi:microcystin-dependent protein